MSVHSQITNYIVNQLKRINGTMDTTIGYKSYTFKKKVGTVKNRLLYLDQVNDFPTICIYDMTESREHIGAGKKFGKVIFSIRGYVREADSVLASEDLADDIEYIIESLNFMRDDICPLLLEDTHITSVQTDEGLFAPYGLCLVTAEIFYQAEFI